MRHLIIGLIAGLGLTWTGSVIAGPHHHHHRHWHHPNFHRPPMIIYRDNWIAPAIGGVILGAAIAEANRRVIIEQQPVIVQNPTVVECTEWKEIMHPDGQIVRERTCTQR